MNSLPKLAEHCIYTRGISSKEIPFCNTYILKIISQRQNLNKEKSMDEEYKKRKRLFAIGMRIIVIVLAVLLACMVAMIITGQP